MVSCSIRNSVCAFDDPMKRPYRRPPHKEGHRVVERHRTDLCSPGGRWRLETVLLLATVDPVAVHPIKSIANDVVHLRRPIAVSIGTHGHRVHVLDDVRCVLRETAVTLRKDEAEADVHHMSAVATVVDDHVKGAMAGTSRRKVVLSCEPISM